jgi:hypothetical protein
VVVEGAAEVGEFEELGKLAGGGGGDFAEIFPEFGRDEIEIESAVETGFVVDWGDGLEELATFGGGEAIFIEGPAAFEGAGAHLDIMLFAAGEVVQGKGKFGPGDEAEVTLEAILQEHAAFGGSVGEDIADEGMGDEVGTNWLGGFGLDEEVDVADFFFAAAETSGDLGEGDFGELAQIGQELFDEGGDVAEAVASGMLGKLGDGFEEIGGGFGAEAWEGGDASVLASGGEVGNRSDAKLIIEDLDFFRSEALEFEELKEAGGKFSPDFFVEL